MIIVANAQHILNAHFHDKSLWFPEGSILRKAVEEARQAGAINSLDMLDLPIQSSNKASEHLSNSFIDLQRPLSSKLGQSEYEHLDDRTFFDRLIQDMKSAQKKAEWQTRVDSRCSLKGKGGTYSPQEKNDGSTKRTPRSGA